MLQKSKLQLYKKIDEMVTEEVKLCAVAIQQIFDQMKIIDINTNFLTVNYPNFLISFHYYQQAENEKYTKLLKESPPTPALTDAQLLKTLKRMCNYSEYVYLKNPELISKNCCLKIENVIKAEWQEKTLKPAYFLWHDDKQNELVLSIRGTNSMVDALTDLALIVEPIQEGVYAHLGIYNAAKWLDYHLFDVVYEFLQKTEDCKLVLVGHSLGAGTAAILAYMWKDRIPDLHSYCLACPPVFDKATSASLKDHVTTVVLRNDIIPRMSFKSCNHLRIKLLSVDWKKCLVQDLKKASEYFLIDKPKNTWENWEKSEEIEKEIVRIANSFKSSLEEIDNKFNISPFFCKLSKLVLSGLENGSELARKTSECFEKKTKEIQQKIKENSKKRKKKNSPNSSLSSSDENIVLEIAKDKNVFIEDNNKGKEENENDMSTILDQDNQGNEKNEQEEERDEEKEKEESVIEEYDADDYDDDEYDDDEVKKEEKEKEKEEEKDNISKFRPFKPKSLSKEEMLRRTEIEMGPPGKILYIQVDQDSKHWMSEKSPEEFLQISVKNGFFQHHFLDSYKKAIIDVKKYYQKN